MSEDILGTATTLEVTPKAAEVVETAIETKPEETIGELETLAEKTNDAIPLKKYMAEKNARKDAEAKAKTLEAELTKLRENPNKSNHDIQVDIKSLSEETGVDESVLSKILAASYSMTKDKVREELEKEINPKLAEFEAIKKDKVVAEFNNKFETLLSKSLEEMPEYSSLVDKDDLKEWVRSGKYSNLSLPQLIEQKYGKFVAGKKSIETSHASKQVEVPDPSKMTDEDWVNLDKNPELKKKWAGSLEERLRKYM